MELSNHGKQSKELIQSEQQEKSSCVLLALAMIAEH